MIFVKQFLYFAFLMTMICSSLCYADHALLQTQDVNKIMKQIFDQHVDKKEMNDLILKKSFKVYIDQFDPHRIYLTEQEAEPYLNLSKEQIASVMEQYKHNDFPAYLDLNSLIQKSIFRSRIIREQIEKNAAAQLFATSSSLSSDGYEDWQDPDLKQGFPKNQNQLQERTQRYLTQLIANERKRFGDAAVLNHQSQTVRLLENQLRNQENQYLFALDNGQPMREVEKQNALSMHILKSLANSLDAHTTVLNPMEAYDMRVRLEKEVDGIGLLLQQNSNGEFFVSQLFEDSPAAKSGSIKLGDKIIEIDGQLLQTLPADQVMELMRGKAGSKINLVLKHSEEENTGKIDKTMRLQLSREVMHVNEDRVQSSYENFGNGIIGMIKLDTFYQSDDGITSEKDMRDAIKKLDKQGNLKGLILDFRENSGGFLSQAVKVAGLFITNGIVVISKYFNGDEHFYRDMDGKMAYDGPLIILTSKATASAAEIVAQSLQDYGVAIIVGDEHTYGKGTIQSQTVTENQSAVYFKVTVGKYYTVSGKTPQIQGVKADVVVPSQFVHENIGEEYLDYPLQEDKIPPTFEDKLEDVPSNLKSWYMHYYVPTIQHKKDLWRNMVPILKQKSGNRIMANKKYQMFLNNSSAAFKSKREDVDLQIEEAVNIAKDMISLETKQRTGNSYQETASTPGKSFPKISN